MQFFPYEYIGEQRSIIEFIRDTVSAGHTAVLESGTGTGKTAVSLSGCLEAIQGTNKKIVYLTRTKSQQKQVLTEIRRMDADIFCVAIQGRNVGTCPMMRDDPELAYGTPEELSRLCSEYKRKDGGVYKCRYYDNIESTDIDEHMDFIRTNHPESEEFAEYCISKELCPYELSKYALPNADVVTVPYPFIFMPIVKDRFLDWMGVAEEDLVLIIDEAHNLPAYLRELLTCDYTLNALNLVDEEAKKYVDKEIYNGLSITDVTAVVKECLSSAVEEYLPEGEDDALIPISYLQDEMMSRLGMSTVGLKALYREIVERGEYVADQKKMKHKLPRSYIRAFGAFLSYSSQSDEETYVALVMGGENPKFQFYCLDPLTGAAPLREVFASVHMSGTLAPLAAYSGELGLRNVSERIFESPFSKDNLLLLYSDDVTTKYDILTNDPKMKEMLEDYVVSLCNATDKNTAVFFPSYQLMKTFIEDGVPDRITRRMFYEMQTMSQNDLMEEVSVYRDTGNSILFAVSGGRISEGLDFPADSMEIALIVGIPYPKSTAKQNSLIRYCDYRFGNGWEYAVKIPTMRKIRQAYGRLIRSGSDRGVVIFLDYRISAFQGIDAKPTVDPWGDLARFFSI